MVSDDKRIEELRVSCYKDVKTRGCDKAFPLPTRDSKEAWEAGAHQFE